MVNLILKKSELQHLILWAERAKDVAEEIGIPFENDELEIIIKLKKARGHK